MSTNEYQNLSQRIPLEGTLNTRDMGGYKAKDGRTLKYKRLIRTDKLNNITDNDVLYIENVLKARFVCDFRTPDAIEKTPDRRLKNCQFVQTPVSADLDNGRKEHPHEEFNVPDKSISGLIHFIYTISPDGDVTYGMQNNYMHYVLDDIGLKNYRKFLLVLKDNKEGSVLFHCADGKDRAGVGAALAMLALGMEKEAAIHDYLKTNEYTKEKMVKRLTYLKEECHMTNEKVLNSVGMLAGVRQNWLEAALDAIDSKYGSIENYFHEGLLLTEEDLQELRDNYLEIG